MREQGQRRPARSLPHPWPELRHRRRRPPRSAPTARRLCLTRSPGPHLPPPPGVCWPRARSDGGLRAWAAVGSGIYDRRAAEFAARYGLRVSQTALAYGSLVCGCRDQPAQLPADQAHCCRRPVHPRPGRRSGRGRRARRTGPDSGAGHRGRRQPREDRVHRLDAAPPRRPLRPGQGELPAGPRAAAGLRVSCARSRACRLWTCSGRPGTNGRISPLLLRRCRRGNGRRRRCARSGECDDVVAHVISYDELDAAPAGPRGPGPIPARTGSTPPHQRDMTRAPRSSCRRSTAYRVPARRRGTRQETHVAPPLAKLALWTLNPPPSTWRDGVAGSLAHGAADGACGRLDGSSVSTCGAAAHRPGRPGHGDLGLSRCPAGFDRIGRPVGMGRCPGVIGHLARPCVISRDFRS